MLNAPPIPNQKRGRGDVKGREMGVKLTPKSRKGGAIGRREVRQSNRGGGHINRGR